MILEEAEFDYLTGIEKELVNRGYKRFRYDWNTRKLIEMKLKGDVSYYFSSMRTLYFEYLKNDLHFKVGLNELHIPPMLFYCNKEVNFNGVNLMIGRLRAIHIQRMLSKIGESNFIDCVENNLCVCFDMIGECENYNRGLLEQYKKKATKKDNCYTYESKTCCF